jgi:hypothetical protein
MTSIAVSCPFLALDLGLSRPLSPEPGRGCLHPAGERFPQLLAHRARSPSSAHLRSLTMPGSGAVKLPKAVSPGWANTPARP